MKIKQFNSNFKFSSFQLVQSSMPLRSLSFILTLLFIGLLLVMPFVPWQQTTEGYGRVVAYAPLDRQQLIESPINGRVVRWHVHEGSRVKKGDPIIDISDNDPDFIERIRQEKNALLLRLDAARSREESIRSRIISLQSSKGNAYDAADSRRQMALDRVRGFEQGIDSAKAVLKASTLQLERQRLLFEKGLTSKRTVELAELELINAETGLDKAKANLDAAKKDVKAFGSDTGRVTQDAEASINDARASLATARSEVARVLEELPRLDARLSRQENQKIFASKDGTVMRILVNPDTQQVKEGDGVALIVPESEDKAVELYIDGNEIPLISEGRKVRLQFQGYPVLQLSGWPEVAVGTFGGTVKLVDVSDNGSGNFRILVVPDSEERNWPSSQYLRQGVRAKGWIFLNRVSIGYELWRRFNFFPPMLPIEDSKEIKLLQEK
jgi:adhesin transport system membrane fusion protein